MAIIQSRGTLRSVEQLPGAAATASAPSVFSQANAATYAGIFASQPNIRTVVTFISRNIADLNLHVFRRISDNDRERLSDHELAQWSAKPNPAMTRFRMTENLMNDMGIYFNAYWLKLRGDPRRLWFVRLPPENVAPDGWLLPSGFTWTLPDGSVITLPVNDVVHFNGYDPSNALMGLSPIETLRKILLAEANAYAQQAAAYANASRIEGVITRPAGAPKWNIEQKQQFREQWQIRYAGNPGQIAVLEDGMTFTPNAWSPADQEFNAARKLSREECARSYHVPLPMVGILDHATFSNIREQHKNLYQDALGPWLTMLQEEFERQILPECDDQDGVYCEFNIDQKLRGSFEEQAAAIQTLVGRPVLTVNEARGRLNLSAIDDPHADQVAQPLNMTTAPATTTPTAPTTRALGPGITAPIIRETWRRQQARLARLPAGERAAGFDRARWDRELSHALEPLYQAAGAPADLAARESAALATTINADTLSLLVAGDEAFSPAREAGLYGY
jgi:HK97 family phage portal protein